MDIINWRCVGGNRPDTQELPRESYWLKWSPMKIPSASFHENPGNFQDGAFRGRKPRGKWGHSDVGGRGRD